MDNKRLVSRDEQRRIQMDMLIEIDAFCKEKGIRYSLAFGTLLGAIRHKGFIPWDDDVDIMMPVDDMMRFKSCFHSDRMKYCDVDTEKHFEYAFSRIADTRTYNERGIIDKSYGVCIDLYPVVPVPSSESERDSFFSNAEKLLKIRLSAMSLKSLACRCLPIRTIPGFDRIVRKYHDFLLYPSVSLPFEYYYIIAGHIALRNKMTYDFDLFDSLVDVPFEEYLFKATSHYDQFLTLRYGDYMTPPPLTERVPYHGGKYYWK